MKLLICNDWYSDKQAHYLNKDGFLRALGLLRDKYNWETIFIKKSSPGFFEHPYVLFKYAEDVKKEVFEQKPDVILVFGDLSRPILGELCGGGVPIALAFTGGYHDDYMDVPNTIFVESQVYYDRFKNEGINVVKAFGTNLEIFKPFKQPKIFDACFPATFAAWKRHDLFAEAMGDRGLACGWFQPHEPECWQACQKYGTALLHHQNAESVNLIYNMSHTCVVTSDTFGGSQRTVLEAMACNVPVIAMSDSDKTTEYIKECGVGSVVEPTPEAIRKAVDAWKGKKIDTRSFIEKNYSEGKYAQIMHEELLKLCQK